MRSMGIKIITATLMYNPFFGIRNLTDPYIIAEIVAVRLLENSSTTESIDVFHVIGLIYKTHIASPFPIISIHNLIIIIFKHYRR